MNQNLRIGFGVLLILLGLVFTFQGLGLLGGSQMTGRTEWAIIGPLMAIVGAILVLSAVRSRRR